MKMKMRRTVCGFLAAAIALTSLPFTAIAETEEETKNTGFYNSNQYVLFATGENSLQLNTSKTTLNGNLYSGGNLDAYSGEVDVNGETILGGELRKHDYTIWSSYMLKENSEEYVLTDFSDEFVNLLGDYYITHEYWQTYSGTDVDSDTSTYAKSGLQYCGNNVTLDGTYISDSYLMISASQALTTSEDSETNLYVKDGNIGIYAGDISLNGVIYAPNGSVQICGTNVEINGMIIAKEIMINAQNVTINTNSNLDLAEHIRCYNNQILLLNSSFDKETELFNVDLFSTIDEGIFSIYTSLDGENYFLNGTTTELSGYTFSLEHKVPEVYIKATQIFDNNQAIESNIMKMVADEELGYGIELIDTDKDRLVDYLECIYRTDINNPDTDGDGLSDYIEIAIINTNPLYVDTDHNGTNDGDEDFDGEKLTNLQEIQYGTNLTLEDTDEDGINDYDEIFIYETNPLNPDSDGDGIIDGDELAISLDPTNEDTDNNGVLDGDEKIKQTFIYEVENDDSVIDKVIINAEATNNLNATTSVESINDIDMLCSNVAGLIGEPFSIETTSQFDEATITFKLDKDALKTDIDNLLFLWYDEENMKFVELDTVYDEEHFTVSTTTTHFSKYMIVDSQEWYDSWALEFNYDPSKDADHYEPGVPVPKIKYNTVLAIDCSGSMDTNDPISSINSGINAGMRSCQRIEASEKFIDYMHVDDKMAIVLFTSTANIVAPMSNEVEDLKSKLQSIYSNGGTQIGNALNTAISVFDNDDIKATQVNNRIILLSDGEDEGSSSLRRSAINSCIEKGIKVITIGLGSANETILQQIADETGGEYYKAVTSDDLVDIYTEIGYADDFDLTDSDYDGLPDAVEIAGIRTHDGEIIYGCDPNNPDTDGDGLLDGEEIDPTPIYEIKGWEREHTKIIEGYYFSMYSNPTKADSDDDGLLDNKSQYAKGRTIAPADPNPMVVDGKPGIWHEHINQMTNGIIATEYDYDAEHSKDFTDILKDLGLNQRIAIDLVQFALSLKGFVDDTQDFWRGILNAIKSICEGSTELGAWFLNFIYDEQHIAYHSQNDTWQRYFGYNDLYDEVFDIGTKMEKKSDMKFKINKDSAYEFVLWTWKGDYWNMQSGAEMGLYFRNVNDSTYSGTHHYTAIGFEVPMTLSLYNCYSKDNIENVFNWYPNTPQWWITGFNPSFTEPDSDIMQIIGTVNLSDRPAMYDGIKNMSKNNSLFSSLIFDDEQQIIWVLW